MNLSRNEGNMVEHAYQCTFQGKFKCYCFQTMYCLMDEIRLKLYDSFDHIHFLK